MTIAPDVKQALIAAYGSSPKTDGQRYLDDLRAAKRGVARELRAAGTPSSVATAMTHDIFRVAARARLENDPELAEKVGPQTLANVTRAGAESSARLSKINCGPAIVAACTDALAGMVAAGPRELVETARECFDCQEEEK